MRKRGSDVKTVVLDTNFLLIPGQFGVDIFSEIDRICHFNYEICVLPATVKELESTISSKGGSARDRRAARLGLQLLRAKGVRVVKTERKVFKSADKAILESAAAANRAAEKSVIVATQDKLLRDKLRAKGVPVIVLRQKRYLQLQ